MPVLFFIVPAWFFIDIYKRARSADVTGILRAGVSRSFADQTTGTLERIARADRGDRVLEFHRARAGAATFPFDVRPGSDRKI